MAIDLKAAQAAQAAAEAASAAAQAAQDGAEIAYLTTVTRLKEITEGRTASEANRLKSRYLSVMGYDAWVRLCANSR
jgi:hypothetical protein